MPIVLPGFLPPTWYFRMPARQSFTAAFTSGRHTALIVAGIIALAGAGAAAAFIRPGPGESEVR